MSTIPFGITQQRKQYQAAYKQFLLDYPQYADTAILDEERKKEYSRFDKEHLINLDNVGSAPYPAVLVKQLAAFLVGNSLANPHSVNKASARATNLIKEARRSLLGFFNAPPKMKVIFASNASTALMVLDNFPFAPEMTFIVSDDTHNSVGGLGLAAKEKGAAVRRVPAEEIPAALQRHKGNPGVLCYTLQSNATGTQYPREWIKMAQERGWIVMVDAAAFVGTNEFNLSDGPCPDAFVGSLYKLCGHPTGIGFLVLSEELLAKLQLTRYTGGSVDLVSIKGDWFVPAEGEAAFEYGTPNFTGLPGVKMGLEYLQKIGMKTIHTRVYSLAEWLRGEAAKLTHSNGGPIVRLYQTKDAARRGGTVACSLLRPDGSLVDERLVQNLATEWGFIIRTG